MEVIERFREHAAEISAVLLDMTMPRLNGEETLRELRHLPNGEDVLVILTSGYNEQGVANRFGEEDIAAFIQKPFKSQELMAKMQQALEG